MRNDESESFLTSAKVRARYGVSNMWLHRRLRDSDFPEPLTIRGRKYWRLSELTKWELARARHEGPHAVASV
jgi:predicted DNA-binding transcriptional regulator AlpA